MLLRSRRAPRRRRTRTFAITAFLAASAIMTACGIDFVATKEFAGPPDASEAAVEASLPPRPDGPGPEPDADAGDGGVLACPAGHGAMVMIDAGGLFFCIDTTEVTNGEYDKFLAATDGGNVDSGAFDAAGADGCASNTTYLRWGAPGPSNFPVVDIDWCDAHGYCRWAGKRLCGKQVNRDASTGEWFAACSNGGKQAYPYGATYEAGACNDQLTGLAAVASHPRCQGSVKGLFDMNSNVSELVDNCGPASCSSMGGDFAGPGSCSITAEYPKLTTAGSIGLRCCADPR